MSRCRIRWRSSKRACCSSRRARSLASMASTSAAIYLHTLMIKRSVLWVWACDQYHTIYVLPWRLLPPAARGAPRGTAAAPRWLGSWLNGKCTCMCTCNVCESIDTKDNNHNTQDLTLVVSPPPPPALGRLLFVLGLLLQRLGQQLHPLSLLGPLPLFLAGLRLPPGHAPGPEWCVYVRSYVRSCS